MEHIANITAESQTPKGSKSMLLRQIERFLRQTDMPSTRFGRLAAQDPRFVADLRNGRTPRERTAERIEEFMRNYQENTHAR